jgi:hypothetical protein
LDWTQMLCMALYLSPLEDDSNLALGTPADWVRVRVEAWCGVPLRPEMVFESMGDLEQEGFMKVCMSMSDGDDIRYVLSKPLEEEDFRALVDDAGPPKQPLLLSNLELIMEFTNWTRKQLHLPYSGDELIDMLLRASVKVG